MLSAIPLAARLGHPVLTPNISTVETIGVNSKEDAADAARIRERLTRGFNGI